MYMCKASLSFALVLRLRMNGAILPLTHKSLQHSVKADEQHNELQCNYKQGSRNIWCERLLQWQDVSYLLSSQGYPACCYNDI